MTSRLRSGSPEAKLAVAMDTIFRTAAGRALHGYLTDTAMTLSAITAHGLADARTTDIAEGRRWLAVELLGARNNLKDIEEDK